MLTRPLHLPPPSTQPAAERPQPATSPPSARHDAPPSLVLSRPRLDVRPAATAPSVAAMSTFYESQAGGDFDRERRRRAFHRIATRLRQAPDDVDEMLPFDEVVEALGSGAQRGPRACRSSRSTRSSARSIAVASQFDRAFRPMTAELRDRWQRVAAARRSGVALPPIDVYRVGGLHFVEDGHHRVSVARALGDDTIEARVREISTSVGASPDLRTSELPLKQHERIFFERVPLPQGLRHRVRLTDEWRYAQLATLVEAGGFRESHARGRLVSREELAEQWYHDQFEPIVAAMREAEIGGPGTDADRYLRFVMLRFLLLYTTDWSDE